MRHKVFAALSALLLMGGAAACGSDDGGDTGSGNSSQANKDPLKVALIPPGSGALATFGAGWLAIGRRLRVLLTPRALSFLRHGGFARPPQTGSS